MAASDVPVFEGNPNSPPRPFAVAAWLGMSPEDILAGLKDGSIAPPPGAPPDWLPPGLGVPLGSTPTLESAPSGSGNDGRPTTNPPIIAEPSVDDRRVFLDQAVVQGWFQALDSTLTDSAFDTIWNHAGASDNSRAANLAGFLTRTLLGMPTAQTYTKDSLGTRISVQTRDALTAFTADPSHHAQIIDLAGMDGAALSKLARTDVGYRYALSELDTVAITGNRALLAAANIDSDLDRFDPDTGEVQLSDAWLADRSKLLAWKMAADAGNDLTIEGNQSWSFIDRSKRGADGLPLTVKLTAREGGENQNQVIFGAANADFIKGQAGTDRIYGGGGDDVLRGAAGADHLEGGHGDDLVFGGSGNDELAGNQGNDEIDGGRGADTLDGGSGDDILTGGRGDDQLAGGDGADTYVIDAGDGTDTITDTDGLGTISVDDETVTGARQNSNGTWTSADGHFEYSLDGDLGGEGTLTIRTFAAGADHAGNPDNVVHVRNWHNGDLGITLGANGSEFQSHGKRDPVIPNAGPQVIADDIPLDDISTPAFGSDAGSASAGTGMLAKSDAPMPGADAGQASATGSPQLDASLLTQPSDIDDALSQLLGSSTDSAPVVDPIQLQHAVAAFTGVLAPPDVSFTSAFGGNSGNDAVSIADVTGALADDAGGHDFNSESAAGLVPLPPEWHRTEGIAVPFDGSGRSAGVGVMVGRR